MTRYSFVPIGLLALLAPTRMFSGAAVALLDKLPLAFEKNVGQTAAQVKFLARTPGYTLFLTSGEAVLAARPGVLRMKLLGANPGAGVSGVNEMAGARNYFIGNDATKWQANVPTYAKVKYKSVYSGIDLVYYGNQRQLEYDFVVAPGADPRRILLGLGGARKISVAEDGDLMLAMDAAINEAGREIRWHRPVAYQEQNGARREIAAHYVVKGKGRVAFEVAKYDASRPLFIDPLIYSTYLGGAMGATGYGIAVDSAGNAYVTGTTYSTDFPTVDPVQAANGGMNDVFVAKFNAAGSALIYSTYLGGSGNDYGTSIAVDSSGNAYITGYTTSPNFPTVNPLQPVYMGGGTDGFDGFVAKLNPAGSALVYSTYLGGNGDDSGNGIGADNSGNAYITGYTSSTNFPTMSPFQPVLNGSEDAFITKIDPTGSAFVYSTYLGGSGNDAAYSIAVDSVGNVYLTGSTGSDDFPVMNPLQPVYGGSYDAFATKLNAAGSALIYSTYLGGSATDQGASIVVDSSGAAYVTGYTYSADFPLSNPFQPTNNGYPDAFVAKLSPSGSSLIYSSFLGGSIGGGRFGYVDNYGYGIAADSFGNAYVAGWTDTTNFPTVNSFQPANGGGRDDIDAFVAKVNSSGSALVYSTYLGGSGRDYGYAIAVDSSGNAYVTGTTGSNNFPTVNPFQPANLGGDAFVTVFANGPAIAPLNLSFRGQTVATASAPQTATLTNTSNTDLTIDVIYIEGPNASDFKQTNDCPASLAAGGSCTISVTFAPSATGSRSAAVAISDNGPIDRQTVPLAGVGVLPAVALSPTSLTFPSQSVFTTSGAQDVTLTNTGYGILSVEHIAVTGPFAQTNTCGATLSNGASCTISVTFTPKQTGSFTGSISIGDNAPGSPQTAPLSGVGVSPAVELSPASLTFADQTIFSVSPPQQVTLTNTGTGAATLTIGSIAATGPFTETNNCGASVNPGASCAISVTFKPTTAGPLTGSVTIHDNAPGPQTVPLTGAGTDIQFAPASWAFGTQPVGTSSLPKKIALTNKGFVTVNITQVSISGADPADFSQTNTCTSVASGASCFITVTFTPTATGKRSAAISVSDNGGGSPQTAALSGSGI